MNAIAGYTSLMLRERYGSLTEKQAHALQRIDENTQHMLFMINSILDRARMEAGRMPVYYEEVDLAAVVTEAMAAVEPLTRETKVGLIVSIANDIPILWTDRGKVKQILLNFLSNAAKFTERGTIEIFAEILPDKHVRIAVRDTGIGIREENLGNVFEAFSQVDRSLTREKSGTGLGLNICERFAALLGGEVDVQSVYGQGSTFSVIIPYAAPEVRSNPEDTSFSQPAETVIAGGEGTRS
jgi:signal transduction histidine kinase